MLLDAYATMSPAVRSGCKLVLAGAPGWGGRDFWRTLMEHPAADEVLTCGYVSDAQAGLLLAGAAAVLAVMRAVSTLKMRVNIVGVIAAVALIGSSRLAIDVARYDVTGGAFLLRAAAFLLFLLVIGASLTAVRARRPVASGVCLSLESGVCFAVSNFCVGPFVGVALRLVGGTLTPAVITLFVTCCALLVAANVLGIDLEPVLKEVHRSNMTKRPPGETAAKAIKGPDWSPPDIQGELMRQGWRPNANT
jgi:hypothetical protein